MRATAQIKSPFDSIFKAKVLVRASESIIYSPGPPSKSDSPLNDPVDYILRSSSTYASFAIMFETLVAQIKLPSVSTF
mgnify:FL=1